MNFGRIDPVTSRDLFIRHALVEGEWDPSHLDKQLTAFLRRNVEQRRKLEKIEELVQGLGVADRMLLAKMDASVLPLTTMTSEPADLRDGLRHVVATDTRGDLGHALAFAKDVLRGAPHPEIIVVSDGALETENATLGLDLAETPIRFIPVGKSGRNVAMLANGTVAAVTLWEPSPRLMACRVSPR